MEQTNSLIVYEPILSPEKALIKLKYSAPCFSSLAANEQIMACKAILVRIHVITGWTLPTDSLLSVLVDQFLKKLNESYPLINSEEIEYAFRNYGTVVKDWGKSMNLSLIDEVLIPYMDERRKASDLEERNVKAKEIIYTDEQLKNFHRQWTEEWYQRIRRGQVEEIPGYSKEILVIDKMIEKEEYASNFIVDCLNKGRKHLYERK